MLCNICHKNPATVHLTEIADEKIVELHVCRECARLKGEPAQGDFNLIDFLGSFSGEKEESCICSNCRLSFSDFKKSGLLGCQNCYQDFELLLAPLLKKIHGAIVHKGKFPKEKKVKIKREDDLGLLKEELEEAIRLEEYEKAAGLRDKIKKISENPGQ